jgi:excisionase family DNA binding protein
MDAPRLYTINQVTEILSIGRTSTYELIRSGRLKSVKIGSSRRIPATSVDDFLASVEDS